MPSKLTGRASDVKAGLQIEMAHQVADALVRLHAMGVLHKDVSPGNIMQSASGVWQLADFGISAVCTSTLGITNATTMAFNLDYTSPEQVDMDARVTDRSDVWCLGASMLHALTGTRPYGNVPPQKIMGSLLRGRGPVIPAAQLAAKVVEVLTACMQGDPERRPTAAQLEQMIAGLHEPADAPASGPSVQQQGAAPSGANAESAQPKVTHQAARAFTSRLSVPLRGVAPSSANPERAQPSPAHEPEGAPACVLSVQPPGAATSRAELKSARLVTEQRCTCIWSFFKPM